MSIASNETITGKKDSFRPGYHLSVPQGWMNDPNGLIYYKGKYHVFYQHNPYAPIWGPMHWGHATSTDLINWNHEPIALSPDKEYEIHPTLGGCFSGSAIELDGKMIIMYTGCVQDREPYQCQALAVSEDGYTFEKYSGNPIIPESPADCTEEFRDPKVWEKDGVFYCVIGSQSGDKGKVLLYRSADLYQWEYIGVVGESDGKLGDMWECPDLCTLEKHDVLIYSPINAEEGDTRYLSGRLDYSTGKLSIAQDEMLDRGSNFYAPQTLVDKNGRRILFGWMRCWEGHMPSEPYGWAGQLTIPRKLWTDDSGILHQEPVEELLTLRKGKTNYELSAVQEMQLNAVESNRYEIILTAKGEDLNDLRLYLRCSEDRKEQTVIHVDAINKKVTVDRFQAGEGEKGIYTTSIATEEDGSYQLHIFIDNNSLELFTSEYTVSMSFYLWPEVNSNGIYFTSNSGQDSSITLDLWELG